MAEKLDFSLPQKKPQGSATGALTVVLLLVLVGLAAANLSSHVSGREPSPSAVAETLRRAGQGPGGQAGSARTCISRRPPPGRTIWRAAKLSGAERARIHFQIGDLLEKAGLYAEAIEHYYRSETAANGR